MTKEPKESAEEPEEAAQGGSKKRSHRKKAEEDSAPGDAVAPSHPGRPDMHEELKVFEERLQHMGEERRQLEEEKTRELRLMEQRILKLEEEKRSELKRMGEERRHLEEENRRLMSELASMRRELRLEGERTKDVEREVNAVEKKVHEEEGALGELRYLRRELDAIRKGQRDMQAALEELSKWKTEALAKMEELERAAKDSEHLGRLSTHVDEIGRHVSKKADIERMVKVEQGIEDMFESLDGLSYELGGEEGLNVGKMPPQVLESAYQTILDDLLRELKKSYGSHETEKIITSVTEDLRMKTSGSELFRVKGVNIELKDIVTSIEKGLISNRQVQMTYEELLKKLAEHVPHYRPKNLRAMLKLKSLEYAVDKLRILIAENEYIKKGLERLMKERGPLALKETGPKSDGSDLLTENKAEGEWNA